MSETTAATARPGRTDSLPVIIVGAGPTGLTAAMELSRMGVPVRLVDEARGPSTTSRALAVQARTLELMDQRGPGPAMVERGNPATSASLYAEGKRLTEVDLSRISSRHPYILLLPQSETEALLRAQVQQQGVTIEWGTQLAAFAQLPHGAGVRAVLEDADGTLESVDGSYLISAEGSHSLARHTLNLSFDGSAMRQSYALADLYLDSDLPQDELSIFLGSAGFLAVFPMGERRYRFMATDPEGRGTDAPAPSLAELQADWDRISGMAGVMHDVTWSSRFAINSRHLTTLRVGNVFFGGDSAHVHSPAGGQGMNTGIQDMIDLSWKIAAVLRGDAAAALLDTYESDRMPIIEELVSTTERGTDIFNSTSHTVSQVLTHALPVLLGIGKVQDLASGLLGEVAENYRTSTLSTSGGHTTRIASLRSGDRLPDLDVIVTGRDTSSPLYPLLDLTRPTVVAVQPDPASGSRPAGWEGALAGWSGVVSILRVRVDPTKDDTAFADPQLIQALAERGGLLLVRPDAYLAALTPLDEPSALTTWLSAWFVEPGSGSGDRPG